MSLHRGIGVGAGVLLLSILAIGCGTPAAQDASDVAVDAPDDHTSVDVSATDGPRDTSPVDAGSDITPPIDVPDAADTTTDTSVLPVDALDDIAADLGADVGTDSTLDDVLPDVAMDATPDATTDTGTESGTDTGADAGTDTGFDAGTDTGTDAGTDTGFDAGTDTGTDVVVDAGFDAGAIACTTNWVVPRTGGGSNGTIAYDAAGGPHVIYLDATDAVLRHAWRVGTAWQTEVVDPTMTTTTRSLRGRPRAAVDSRGRVHVTYAIYSTASGVTLEYAVLDAGTWSRSDVGTGTGIYPAIAVDSHDDPHVVWRSWTSSTAPYTVSTWSSTPGPTGWTHTLLDRSTVSDPYGEVAMAIDATDRVWASFSRNTTPASVVVCEQGPTGYTSTPITFSTGISASGFLSMAVDPTGSIAHVVRGQAHAYGEGLFWSQDTLAVQSGYSPIVRIDGTGAPVIGFGYWTGTSTLHNDGIAIARYTGTAWTRTVSLPSDFGTASTTLYNASAFDPAGTPVVVFNWSDDAQHLALSTYDTGMQVTTDVDYKQHLVNRGLTVLPAPDGTVDVVTWIDGQLWVANVDPSGAVTVRPPVPGSLPPNPFSTMSPAPASAAYGSDGLLRVASNGRTAPYTPFVSRWDGSTWLATPPVPAGSVDTIAGLTALAVGPTLDPQIVFVRDSGSVRSIYHAAFSSGIWTTTLVQSVSTADAVLPQLLVDASGIPSVVYYAAGNIMLARPIGSTWAVATVTPTSRTAFRLYVDRTGRTCVGYTLTSPERLVKSCLAGGSFAVETVATSTSTPAPFGQSVVAAGIDSDGLEYLITSNWSIDGTGSGSATIQRLTYDGAAWIYARPLMFPGPPAYPFRVAMSLDHRIHQVRDPGTFLNPARWLDTACAP